MEDAKEFWDTFHYISDLSGDEKENQTQSRLQYAENLLKENDISYKVCNANIGHINLLNNGKVVMSFWVRTGKFYCPETKESDYVGIRKAIKIFKRKIRGK